MGKKKIWVKKILGKKNIGSKNFGMKKMLDPKKFCLKKTGRVNPGWRIYAPPPENGRVKIVLDCC